MKKYRGSGTIVLIGVLAALFIATLTVPAMLAGAGILIDKNQPRTQATPCVKNGASGKLFGIGYKSSQKQDRPCNQRASINSLADVGLGGASRISTCGLESNLREFASVINCLGAGNIPYSQIAADVKQKQSDCGGPDPKWRKKKAYRKCMGRKWQSRNHD